jgi:hypothetical protein
MADAHGTVRVARIYDEPSADDGRRILVDRLWPRGVSKERARLDDWCKESDQGAGDQRGRRDQERHRRPRQAVVFLFTK